MRTFFASIFLSIFLLTAPLMILAHSVIATDQETIYDAGISTLSQIVTLQPGLDKLITADELTPLVKKHFPIKLITEFLTSIQVQMSNPKITKLTLEFKSFQKPIIDFMKEFGPIVFQKIPDCPKGTLPKQEGIPECLPKGTSRAALQKNLEQSIAQNIASAIPEKKEFPVTEKERKQFQIAQTIYKLYRLFWIPFLLLLLAIAALILWKPLSRIFRKIGSTLFWVGMELGVITWIATLAPSLLNTEMEKKFSGVSSGIQTFLKASILPWGITLGAIGIVLWITGLILGRKQNKL